MANESWKKTGIAPEGYTIVPADGGWGWLVLLGCYICGAVICFPLIAFAITINEVKAEFNISTSMVSWPYAALVATAGFLGPFAAMAAGLMSSRKVAILGGFLYSITLVFSAFTTNIAQLIFIFGIVGGMGDAFLYVPLASILSGYFQENYGIVSGIFTSAFSMSKLVLVPMADYLTTEYGWRGCMLIVGGMGFNACVGAALFQPQNWHWRLKANDGHQGKLVMDKTALENGQENICLELEDESIIDKFSQLAQLQFANDKELQHVECQVQQNGLEFEDVDLIVPDKGKEPVENDQQLSLCDLKTCSKQPNCQSLEENGHKFHFENKTGHQIEEKNVDPHKFPSCDAKDVGNSCDKAVESFGSKLRKAMDPRLLKMLNFYMFTATYCVTFTVAMCASSYLFSFGVEAGLEPRDAAWFASVQAVGEVFGRLSGTAIIKVFNFPTIPTYIISMGAAAMTFIALTLMNSPVPLYLMGATNGIIFGMVVSISFSLIMETVGVQNIMPTMGYCVLFQGICQLTMGPFSGWLRDTSGSYDTCFIMYGCFLALVSVAWFLFFICQRHQKHKKAN